MARLDWQSGYRRQARRYPLLHASDTKTPKHPRGQWLIDSQPFEKVVHRRLRPATSFTGHEKGSLCVGL